MSRTCQPSKHYVINPSNTNTFTLLKHDNVFRSTKIIIIIIITITITKLSKYSAVMLSHTFYKSYYLLTYSMVQSLSWAANWFAATQEIPRISQNQKVHYRTHKRPPPISILGQPNPVHIPTSHLLEIRPNKIIIYLFTAIGLSPGGSGYFTCKQNMKLVTDKFKSGGLHEKHVVVTWNIIHPSTPTSSQWSPSLRFPHQDPTHPPLLTHMRRML
jgi:hypothetical protein